MEQEEPDLRRLWIRGHIRDWLWTRANWDESEWGGVEGAIWTKKGDHLMVFCCFNPFSHYVICVSRLTAVGHMRHPLKADLGKNEDEFCVCLCVRPPEHVPRNDSKQSGGGRFLRFSL